MSRRDFVACTPSEFSAIYRAYGRELQQAERAAWERARISWMYAVQPYSKKPLKPTDLMSFGWDAPERGKPKNKEPLRERRQLTREEELQRYREAARLYNLKNK